MKRMLILILFELKKILNRKKAFLFLTALNIIPLIASLALLVSYLKFKSFGLGELQLSILSQIIQTLFTWHFKLFSIIAPFFLALVVGDSFSTELSHGHMKMLLLTPVSRWQVISAKTVAIITFLLLAICIGSIFLQADLFIARAISQHSGNTAIDMISGLAGEATKPSVYLVSTSSAFQLLVMSFLGNLMIIGFFIIFSLFFESAILMSFASLIVLMGIHTFYLVADNILVSLDASYAKLAEWCFTRHFTDLFSVENIENMLLGKVNIFTIDIANTLSSIMAWTAVFYIIAAYIFSRRQIPH